MATFFNLLHLPFPKSLTLSSSHFPLPFSSPNRRRLLLPISATHEAIINPAFANSNILHFGSGYNVQIVVDEDESEEALMRRFRREVSKAGVIQECKRRRFFENKQEEKKRKHREACRRNRRRRLGPRFTSNSPQADADAVKKSKDDDDNWDLPEGDLPY